MTAFIRILVVAGLAGCAACASSSRPVVVPGAGEATITRGAHGALEARWGRVDLGVSPVAPCPTADGPAPVLVEGDFNGDGTPDTALWVTADGTSRLAVLFARLNGEYTVGEVGGDAMPASGTLGVGRRATSYQLASLTVDSYFSVDTIVLRACDGTPTAWFWNGSTFEAQTLAR